MISFKNMLLTKMKYIKISLGEINLNVQKNKWAGKAINIIYNQNYTGNVSLKFWTKKYIFFQNQSFAFLYYFAVWEAIVHNSS